MIGSRKAIMVAITIVVIASAIPSAFGAICPNNIPVVTLPPHSQGGFSWGAVIRPMGDACVENIAVEPANALAWYVGGQNGLYMTKNGGQTWTHPLNGMAGPLLLVPGPPTQNVYIGIGKTLYLSRDHGQNWTAIKTFSATVRSLLVNGGTLYVGLAWTPTRCRAASGPRISAPGARSFIPSAPDRRD